MNKNIKQFIPWLVGISFVGGALIYGPFGALTVFFTWCLIGFTSMCINS